MHTKNKNRLKRAKRTRAKLRQVGTAVLSVHKTGKHIYAQIFSSDGEKTLASVSTRGSGLNKAKNTSCNIETAKLVGASIAKKAKDAGIDKVGFDRSGFLYHGKIKALAEAAREAGLKF